MNHYQVQMALLCYRSELNDTRDLLPLAELKELEEKAHATSQLDMYFRTKDDGVLEKFAALPVAATVLDLVERMPAAKQTQEESFAALHAAAHAMMDEAKAVTGTLREKRAAAAEALAYAEEHGTAVQVEVARKEVNRLNSLRRRMS